jgi:hypothetical protein
MDGHDLQLTGPFFAARGLLPEVLARLARLDGLDNARV